MRRGRAIGIASLIIASVVLASLLVGIVATDDQSITPNDEFFTISISDPPVIDPGTWRLRVDGLVDRPMNLTYAELVALSNKTERAQLRCVTGPSATAYYTGVTLPEFMDMIGVRPGARELVFFCADSAQGENYSTSLTVQELSRDDVLLAWAMNNATLPVDQGFPLKLVVPGDWGYKWAKWIVHISVIDYDYGGYWERRGWADDASISPISDWIVHAVLLSAAAVLGGLAAITGLTRSRDTKLASRIPEIVPGRYHARISAVYYVLLLLVFLYWATVTYANRGALFYSFHGRIALITVVLSILGIATSIPVLSGADRFRTAHFIMDFGGYLMLLITIALGVALALG